MNAGEVLVVLCTAPAVPAPGQRSARELATALVEARLCACANVVPAVASVFRWQGRVDTAQEELLLLKTTRAALPALQERLLALHPYACPELLALPVAGGSPPYLRWVAESVGPAEA